MYLIILCKASGEVDRFCAEEETECRAMFEKHRKTPVWEIRTPPTAEDKTVVFYTDFDPKRY